MEDGGDIPRICNKRKDSEYGGKKSALTVNILIYTNET